METITTSKGVFLFVEVHRSGVVFYESMGYLIYKEPAYENWVTDDELSDPVKLDKFLKKNEGKSDFKPAYVKLPEGRYKFIAVMESGVLNKHEASQNLTEETAGQIVDAKNTTAMDQFQRFLFKTAHTLKSNQNYAILKLIP